MNTEEQWVKVEDKKPHNGQRIVTKYDGVYTDRVCHFWRGSAGDEHFGYHNEADGRGSQPATHWRAFK